MVLVGGHVTVPQYPRAVSHFTGLRYSAVKLFVMSPGGYSGPSDRALYVGLVMPSEGVPGGGIVGSLGAFSSLWSSVTWPSVLIALKLFFELW